MRSFPIVLAGGSAEATRAREACARAATRTEPLLIVAEDGIDPQPIARAVHSGRRAGRFVVVDCAAASPQDLETELFGARDRANGPIEVLSAGAALLRAGRGTLFLLGAGELPASAQGRLARLLRDGEARSAGRTSARVSARIMVSALPTLAADVRDGRFRSDLYRRLSALEVVVPPLRRRAEDFSALVPLVSRAIAGRLGRPAPAFTQAALTVLSALPWRRNLEELEALLERILRAIEAPTIRQEDVLAQLSFDSAFAPRTPSASLREARQRFERDYIQAVLEHHRWQMSAAARTLGIERANLYRKARQLGISRGAPSGAAGR
ncbi:MAG: sigma-54-dependent transcriptional regulator [Vicinamibacterales bacterium]